MPTPAHLKTLAVNWWKSRPSPQPAQLQDDLAAAARYVRKSFLGVDPVAARAAALAAWSEIAAEQSRAYVDLEASTPQLLVLVDQVTKTRRLIPVADLVRILGPRVVA